MQNLLKSIIEKGRENHPLKSNLSSEKITDILFVTARGVIYEWSLYDGKLDLNIEMKTIISIMVDGLM